MGNVVTFEDWTAGRTVPHYGTNAGLGRLPFQSWRKVKEAFAPEVVARAIRESSVPVTKCLDPFAGSGTTPLACQFLGVAPAAIEVNPYLADLTRAKLETYDVSALRLDLDAVVEICKESSCDWTRWDSLPGTFVEPGRSGKWVFDRVAAQEIGKILDAIDAGEKPEHRRLFRVLLSGLMLDVSNVVVNGKGRRYRRSWATRPRSPDSLVGDFGAVGRRAIDEIQEYSARGTITFDLLLGDARKVLPSVNGFDLAVFSPPYPNSFDYTDIYNIELWMLGYLVKPEDNRALRTATLPSHVQIGRTFDSAPSESPTLNKTLEELNGIDELWSPWIPDMIGAYFASLGDVIAKLGRGMTGPGCEAWVVIGDSRYAGVRIDTATILAELAPACGFEVKASESSRSLRASAQQGGQRLLPETLVVLARS